MITDTQEQIFEGIATSLERIADALEKQIHINIDHGRIEQIDHARIDDIGEIHGDVTTHPKPF
jgi:hypothetical protein